MIDAHRLGAWKPEGEITRLAVAGKKLYAAWNGDEIVKTASKGFAVSDDTKDNQKLASIILDLARGGKYHHKNAAPNFKLSGDARFVAREIQSTF